MPINAPYHSSMDKEVQKAANIINSFFNNSTIDADSAIPAELIKNCAGLAFLTVVKAGMIWTGKVGTGVVIARLEDGSWSPPSGIGTAGIGFGAEIGGEIVDFMIVLGSRSAVNTFKKGTQVSVGAGLELAVGPVGRAAGANVNAGGGGMSANYTYSRAKGAFAGVGLHGSTILVRGEMNSKFYGRDVKPAEILSGHVQAPAGSCDRLYEAIRMAEGKDGVSIYPSTDPRSSNYTGNASSNTRSDSFGNRSSFNSSFNNGNSSFNNGNSSFNHGSSAAPAASSAPRSSLSMPATTQPPADDPRLKRYSTYKSERELYDQYSKTKSPAAAAASTTTQSYGGGYTAATAVPAAAAYGAQSAHVAQPAYGAQQAYGSQPTAYAVPVASAPAAAPAVTSQYGAYNTSSYGYSAAPAAAASPAPAPAPTQAAAPTRLSYKTVPATNYVPNYGSQTSSSSSSSSSYSAPASKAVAPPVPPPAIGAETKQVYTQVIGFVGSKCPHANVQIFKDNCRLFGQDQMSLDAYFAYLASICTTALLKELVPQLVRLLPTQDKRENLWSIYVREVLMIR